MNSIFLDVFFPKHSYSEAPISVITEILSENDTSKFLHISYEFRKLRFTKVKDLARATIAKVSSIKLLGDTLTLLYGAMEKYSVRLAYSVNILHGQNRHVLSRNRENEDIFLVLCHLLLSLLVHNEIIHILDQLLISAVSEHENGNLIGTLSMCKELLMHKPRDLDVMLLYANALFNSKKYVDCIRCLDNARNIHPNNSEFLSKFAFLVYVMAVLDSTVDV